MLLIHLFKLWFRYSFIFLGLSVPLRSVPHAQPWWPIRDLAVVCPSLKFLKVRVCYLRLDALMNSSWMKLGVHRQHYGIDLFILLHSVISLTFPRSSTPLCLAQLLQPESQNSTSSDLLHNSHDYICSRTKKHRN